MMATPLVTDLPALLALAADAQRLFNPPGQIPPGAQSGERASRQQGRGLNFDSLRRYQPGDDVRLIDWQATARLRTPWVRLYNEERERPVFLIVDQRIDMYFATRGQTKSAAAATVAALLAWRSWHDGDRLGGVVFSDSEMALTPCRSPRQSLHRLLDRLAHYNQQLGQPAQSDPDAGLSLTEVLNRVRGQLPGGCWVAIVSDFHDLDEQAEALLVALSRRCEVHAFITLDDLHQRLPASGQLAAHYRQQQTVFSLSPALRERIEESVTARLARLEQRLTRLGIAVRQIVVSEPLLPQLQQGDRHAGKRL